MDKYLNLTIVSPNGILFEGKVNSVSLPGISGGFSVLPLHAPLITELLKGKISYSLNNELSEIEVKGGFVEVKQDIVSVCVEQ